MGVLRNKKTLKKGQVQKKSSNIRICISKDFKKIIFTKKSSIRDSLSDSFNTDRYFTDYRL